MRPPPATSKLRRLRALPRAERRLLFEAWWTLLVAALRLRLAPRRILARAMLAPAPREGRNAAPASSPLAEAHAAALAVGRAAAHHLGVMTCLPRALALQRMLAKRALPAVLRIGVRKDSGTLTAHAWVEIAGQAIGEPEAIEERFRPLLPPSPAP